MVVMARCCLRRTFRVTNSCTSTIALPAMKQSVGPTVEELLATLLPHRGALLRGRVLWFNPWKRYGFIAHGRRQIFFHVSATNDSLRDNDPVEFSLEKHCKAKFVKLAPPQPAHTLPDIYEWVRDESPEGHRRRQELNQRRQDLR